MAQLVIGQLIVQHDVARQWLLTDSSLFYGKLIYHWFFCTVWRHNKEKTTGGLYIDGKHPQFWAKLLPAWISFQMKSFFFKKVVLYKVYVSFVRQRWHLTWNDIRAKSKRSLRVFSSSGAIITLLGKIYPSKDKTKWAAFGTVTGLHFLGNSDTMIYFWVEPQSPPKMKKLESWWLIAIFNNFEG